MVFLILNTVSTAEDNETKKPVEQKKHLILLIDQPPSVPSAPFPANSLLPLQVFALTDLEYFENLAA